MAFKFKSVVGGFVIIVMLATFVAIITMLVKLYMVLHDSNNDDGVILSTTASSSKQHPTKNTKNGDEKMVTFIHFQKAGGSSIVSTFEKYNMNLWEPNYNGNPWIYNYTTDNNNEFVKNMSMIPIWRFEDREFLDFVKQAKHRNVDLITMEWNFFMKLSEDVILSHLHLITCIRDPYERFVSNLFFEPNTAEMKTYYSQHPIEWMNVNLHWANHPYNRFRPKWQDFPINYNKPNYYTAFLNGLAESPTINVNISHLEIAKYRLQNWFSSIIGYARNTFGFV